MSRDPQVREQAYIRDEYRCQVCGFDGRDIEERLRLSPHHGVQSGRLGMGGSEAKDVVDNVITLCQGPNSCHDKESRGLLRITEYDFDQGVFKVQVRNSVQDEWRDMEEKSLWFHRARKKKRAEEAISRLHTVETIDYAVAKDLYDVQEGYDEIDEGARSFDEFVSSLGWKPEHAVSAARAYGFVLTRGLEWPYGVNYRKVLLIASAEPDNPDASEWDPQRFLNEAADKSQSVIKDTLIRAGFILGDWGTYIVIRLFDNLFTLGSFQNTAEQVKIVRSRRKEAVIDFANELGQGYAVAGPLVFRKGLKWVRTGIPSASQFHAHKGGGRLVDAYGRDVKYIIVN
jgi:hypothetical protein